MSFKCDPVNDHFYKRITVTSGDIDLIKAQDESGKDTFDIDCNYYPYIEFSQEELAIVIAEMITETPELGDKIQENVNRIHMEKLA